MKRIVTSYGGFRTGDAIADAVARYSLALAKAHDTDTVDVPFLSQEGGVDRVQMRIGWLVDIGVIADEGAHEEPADPETVERLNERAQAIEDLHFVHEEPARRTWVGWELYL